jgi:hypothetical protein
MSTAMRGQLAVSRFFQKSTSPGRGIRVLPSASVDFFAIWKSLQSVPWGKKQRRHTE